MIPISYIQLIAQGEPRAPRLSVEQGLPLAQQIVALVVAVSMLVVVIELVRKRKLREEYSVIWSITAVVLLALAIDMRVLRFLMDLLGADQGTSVLFFGALIFLMLAALQFSTRLSKLTFRNKTLSQRMALLERELEDLKQRPRPRQSTKEDVA